MMSRDFVAEARAELLAEDTARFEARVKERARRSKAAADMVVLPTDRAECERRLVVLRTEQASLQAKVDRAKRNPMVVLGADEEATLRRVTVQIDSIERSVSALGRAA